ncbi:hypothetical protein M409DRAFT_54821 [Zasmidium cellare ATCC 36951]|uniref:Uncharacterized protein n=1 Tax=Zasmidium cellare ATCC 36951 TaxID=1080233 RepID=A0A6A6CJV1_ZASCE|nr:uncharacterized protein M409DRAFT_54821 [Zasmidium cellare ATCC 36951]KAF2166478.1 hypothetical protein M409DRAFT_54821 [Zasmidium cellare ATCC 36951]
MYEPPVLCLYYRSNQVRQLLKPSKSSLPAVPRIVNIDDIPFLALPVLCSALFLSTKLPQFQPPDLFQENSPRLVRDGLLAHSTHPLSPSETLHRSRRKTTWCLLHVLFTVHIKVDLTIPDPAQDFPHNIQNRHQPRLKLVGQVLPSPEPYQISFLSEASCSRADALSVPQTTLLVASFP